MKDRQTDREEESFRTGYTEASVKLPGGNYLVELPA